MTEQIGHDEYKDVIFGSCHVNMFEGSKFVEQKKFYILVPNILRWTEKRQEEFGRILWLFSGAREDLWDAATDGERRRWSRLHMGRYNYVEIFTYDDETWGYRADSAGGGNWPLASLKIVKGES